jgi:hypothetical protein
VAIVGRISTQGMALRNHTTNRWDGFKDLPQVYLAQFIKLKLAPQNITVKKVGIV